MISRWLFLELRNNLLHEIPFKPSPNCLSLPSRPLSTTATQHRASSSSTRWKSRQGRDHFAREAKVQGLKSRAAFKLLEMNEKYKLFHPGDTVVDLGYAPGSWSQVAINRTAPNGRVVGIDIIPAQPPRGVSTIQGNFLSPDIQAEVRAYVQDPARGRARRQSIETEEDVEAAERGYIDMERRSNLDSVEEDKIGKEVEEEDGKRLSLKERDEKLGRVVDVVLSDMFAPWEQTDGFAKNSVSNPYIRMMNTSGVAFKDHVGSMDLCLAALTFAFDTLCTGGHFVCKFYQGAEDKVLEKRLKKLFAKVHRQKPESSRSESREGFFVALRRKENALREDFLEDT